MNFGIPACFAFCVLLTQLPQPQGAVVFKVVESESILTASGFIATSIPIGEQAPGSLATTYGGEIHLDLGESGVQFLAGSFLDANINGEWQPEADGLEGFAPADFAGQAAVFFGTVKGAFRNIRLNLSSEVIPVEDGAFNGKAVGYLFPEDGEAVFDYNAGLFGVGGLPLSGMASFSKNPAATLTTEGGSTTLRLEFEADYKFGTVQENDSTLTLKGTIVARAEATPPPALSARLVSATPAGAVVLEANSSDPELKVEASVDLSTWNLVAPQSVERDSGAGTTRFNLAPTEGTSRFFRLRR